MTTSDILGNFLRILNFHKKNYFIFIRVSFNVLAHKTISSTHPSSLHEMIAFKLRRVKVSLDLQSSLFDSKQNRVRQSLWSLKFTAVVCEFREKIYQHLVAPRRNQSTFLTLFHNHKCVFPNIYILEFYPSLDESESPGESVHRRSEYKSILFSFASSFSSSCVHWNSNPK